MKKILVICIAMLFIFNLTGCSSDDNVNMDVLDSKLDYVLFRDKKIYLSKNLEQFVLQFQGLKCKLNRNMDIDNITSKEHKFYQLKDDDFDITCPSLEIKYPADFSVMLDVYDVDYSVDGEIYHWTLSGGIDESLIAFFNGKKIFINGDDASSKEDVIKVMGKDYEYEEDDSIRGWFDLNYENDGFYFSFNDDNELVSIYVD